jgi:hypothetical protein
MSYDDLERRLTNLEAKLDDILKRTLGEVNDGIAFVKKLCLGIVAIMILQIVLVMVLVQ